MKRMMRHVHALVFAQDHALERLAAVRVTLGAAMLLFLVLGPPRQFFPREAALLCHPMAGLDYATEGHWALARGALCLLAVGVLVGWRTRLTSLLLALGFLALNSFIARCTDSPQSNANLHWFCFAVAASPAGARWSLDARRAARASESSASERASFALFFMQLYVAVLYLQAWLAKLLFTGPSWYLEHRTTLVHTIVEPGTALGLWLTRFPAIFTGGAWAAGLFEIAFFVLFWLGPRWQRWLAVIAMGFHLGTLITLGISFWFLWCFYPALFVWRARGAAPLAAPATVGP